MTETTSLEETITISKSEYEKSLKSSFARGRVYGNQQIINFIASRAGIIFARGSEENARLLLNLVEKINCFCKQDKLGSYLERVEENEKAMKNS